MNEKALRILEYNKITEKLTDCATSPMGRELCRKLLPSTDLGEICQGQMETSDALSRIYAKGSLSFSGLRNIRDSLLRLKVGSSLSITELMHIASLLETALRAKSYGRRETDDMSTDSLDGFFNAIEPLSPVCREIRRCILSEEEIADDASAGLKHVRRSIKLTNERIHSQLNAMVNSSSVSSMLQDNLITMRGGRYCLPVKAEYRSQIQGMIHDQSSSGSTLFIEPMAVVKLNNDLRELAAKEKEEIDMVILATESGIDQSKAAAVFVHGLLGIQPFARSFEMKEACYAATAALDYAKLHVEKFPQSKVLVIASDIAKYGIDTPGEPTQGAGAVAMLVTQNPRILAFNDDNVAQTRDVMDFWRPNYSSTPFVNGIYSTQQYLDCLKTTWTEYQKRTGLTLDDFAAVCFHLPYPKLALKGLKKILDKSLSPEKQAQLQYNFEQSILYSQKVGNIYTGSLFLGLLSLLENQPQLVAGDRIALYGYGSGAVAEIFSAHLVEGFEQMLHPNRLAELDQRKALTIAEYEKIFFEEAELDAEGNQTFQGYQDQTFALSEINEHQRTYVKVEHHG